MNRYSRWVSMGIAVIALTASLVLRPGIYAQAPGGTEFQITVNSSAHQTLGLYYPVTYMFQIPAGSSGLTAQYRFNQADNWTALQTRTSTELFNGVNAARFDYPNNMAYLSVAFSSASDNIYIRVLSNQNAVNVAYVGIPLYYDNRHAAVTVTLDDWSGGNDYYFDMACSALTGARVVHTVALETATGLDWALVQDWVNQGYTEPSSHSRTHPCTDAEYRQGGYTGEITGSRDDILAHLTLQNRYVPAYIEPCGFYNAALRQVVVGAHYLSERGFQAPPVENTFSAWVTDGAYARVMYSWDTWNWQTGGGTAQMRDQANSAFNQAYAAGGIYHLVDHPWEGLWGSGSYLNQHIDYINDRPDVWYAGFGHLYLYHYVQERGQVTIVPVNSATPTPTFTPGGANTPTPTPTATSTPGGEVVNPSSIAALPAGTNVLLNFDNFASPVDGVAVPASYGGCTWQTLVEGSSWAGNTTWNIYITNGGVQGTVVFPRPVIVRSVRVGSVGSNQFTLRSTGNTDVIGTTSGSQLTLTTGWTQAVTSLTLRSSTGDQFFDDLRLTTGDAGATPTPTITSTATATPTNTATSTPVATNTATSTPVATNTPTPTNTATSTPVATNTPTSTETATSTPVATNTPTSTETATSTPVATNTPTPTETATSTPVATSTPTPTPTATSTPGGEVVNPSTIATLPVGTNVLFDFNNFASPVDGVAVPASYGGCTWQTLIEGSPWAGNTTWNIYITNGGVQGTVVFPRPVIVRSVRVGSVGSNQFTLRSTGNTDVIGTTSGSQLTLTTGWTQAVTSLTLRSSTSDQFFDDLMLTINQ